MAGETLSLQSAISIFQDHLEDIKNAVAENMLWRLQLEEEMKFPPRSDEYEQELCDALYEMKITQLVEPYKRVIKRIVSRQQNFGKVKQMNDKLTPDQIERAREYPMEQLFDGQLFKGGGQRLTGRCPFHQERTPSFTIFLKTNKWRCFGCGKYGDTIQYLEELEGIRFKAAVRKLISM